MDPKDFETKTDPNEEEELRRAKARVAALRQGAQKPEAAMVGTGMARNAADALRQRPAKLRNAIDEQTQ